MLEKAKTLQITENMGKREIPTVRSIQLLRLYSSDFYFQSVRSSLSGVVQFSYTNLKMTYLEVQKAFSL